MDKFADTEYNRKGVEMENTEQRILLTLDEVGRRLSLSRSSLRRIIERGGLPVIRLGERSVRIAADDLETWLKAQRAA